MSRIGAATVLFATACVVSAPASAPALVHAPASFLAKGTTRGTVTSANWSGFGDSAAVYTDVHASWVQPAASCTTAGHKYAAFWVGLDGYTSTSVEQIGADSDCASKGKPSYYGWFEMYPAPSFTLTGYAVSAGDSLTADVSAAAGTFTLTLTNNTKGWTFHTVQSSSAQPSSAEWIAEAPSLCRRSCRVLPLANFGTVTFTNAGATGNLRTGTIASFTNDAIAMATRRGVVKAQPGPLSATGDSFSATWHHA